MNLMFKIFKNQNPSFYGQGKMQQLAISAANNLPNAKASLCMPSIFRSIAQVGWAVHRLADNLVYILDVERIYRIPAESIRAGSVVRHNLHAKG
jgi:hypothetical protein